MQFVLIVYKICYFHIQLTANIEHKPKNQHAKTCRLMILDFTVKGFALRSLASSSQPQHILPLWQSFPYRIYAWYHCWSVTLRFRDAARICLPRQAWTKRMQTRSNSQSKRIGLHLPHRYAWPLSPFKSCWLIRKWGVQTNTDYWHP